MVEVRYLGHSAVLLTDGKTRIVIDPFLTGNPMAALGVGEVQADLIRGAGEGQLLLVHWSLVNQAGAAQGGADRPSRREPTVIVDAEFTTTGSTRGTANPAQDPAAVDQEFMSLMNGTRIGKAFTSRDIDHELSTLLGSAGAKGQK